MTNVERLNSMGFDIGTKFEDEEGDDYVVLHYDKEHDIYGIVLDFGTRKEKWHSSSEVLTALTGSEIIITVSAPNSSCCNGSKVLSHKEMYPHICEYCRCDSYNGGMNNVDCSNSNCITKRS